MDQQRRLSEVEALSQREREAKEVYEQAREAARLANEHQRATKREWDRLIAELRNAVVSVVDDNVATSAQVLNTADRSWEWWARARREFPASQ